MELKPCPFCECDLVRCERKEPWGQRKTIYMHPDNGCVFLSLYVDGTNAFAWNRRVGEGEKK